MATKQGSESAAKQTREGRALYIKGQRGGYDPKTHRWRNAKGRFCSERRALDDRAGEFYGALVPGPDLDDHIVIQAAKYIEQAVGGIDPNRVYASVIRGDTDDTSPMPSDILAMMQLAEYYMKTEGDVFQTIEAPLQIGLRELRVSSKDPGVEDLFRELYDEANLDMLEVLYDIWLCTMIYGQAFPLELYNEATPASVVLLNPKHMQVGRALQMGYWSLDLSADENWVEELKKSADPDLVFRSLGQDYDESVQQGYVPIKRDYCDPVRYTTVRFKRYAIPPLARAYRSISTRQVLEEYIRATIEGYRSQLWTFILGNENRVPSPDELELLTSTLAGSVGDRTGYLVWRGPLEVKAAAPQPLDALLGNERWQALTAHIFRQLGISTRVISGEAPMGSSRSGEELDIKTLLARLEFMRGRCMRWLHGWNRRYVEKQKNSPSKDKLLENMPKVQFGEDFLEMEQLVKGVVQPLLQFGILSRTTALEKVGIDYDTELERKKQEAPDEDLFRPPPSYAQVRPTTSDTIEYTPEGRPPEGTPARKPIKVEAARIDYPADVQEYEGKALAAYDEILAAPVTEREDAVLGFRETMQQLNSEYTKQYYTEGYNIAHGWEKPDETRVAEAVRWNDDYLAQFIDQLLASVDDDDQLKKWRDRAKLYGSGAYRKGFMMGIFQAMEEQGAKGWRRILHPERSESGPCDDCIADSRLIHPITEEFSDHVWGVCTAQSIYFYRHIDTSAEVPMGFPVPYPEGAKRVIRRVR
jgi:hypothetical protein